MRAVVGAHTVTIQCSIIIIIRIKNQE